MIAAEWPSFFKIDCSEWPTGMGRSAHRRGEITSNRMRDLLVHRQAIMLDGVDMGAGGGESDRGSESGRLEQRGSGVAPDDEIGTLVWRDSDLQETAETVRRSSVVPAPLVTAVRCPSGHPNAPYAAHCRVCGANVPTQDVVAVPRPPMGRLVTSTGAVVYLDRDIIIGRSPTEIDGSVGPVNLVALGVDNDRVSRNHVEVVIEGWRVIVRDLGSKNGTTITMPGGNPQGLPPNEPWEMQSHTTVTIGEGASFEFRADLW